MIKDKKTSSITFRMKPEIKTLLKTIAEKECRSMAAMIEILICERSTINNILNEN